jgi:Inner membrane component of T3SS, cytoplasmic domain
VNRIPTRRLPTLVVLGSGVDAGRQLPLAEGRLLIGRGVHNDLQLADIHVSRRHAAVSVNPNGVWLEDLDSASGTYVNGNKITTRRQVRHRDVITFGTVQLQMHTNNPSEATASLPVAPPTPESVRVDIGRQDAGMINNAGRDLFLLEQRESFLREIAATRTKARWLVWLGLLIMLGGFGWTMMAFLEMVPDFTDLSPAAFDAFTRNFERYIWGMIVAIIGQFLLIMGVVLHIIATARGRRLDRELPLPRRFR